MREQRKKNLEEHVETVNQLLRRANGEETEDESHDDEDEAENKEEHVATTSLDPRDEEYIDEDRYTTVTVEPMRFSDDERNASDDDRSAKAKQEALAKQSEDTLPKKKRVWTREKPDDARAKKKKKKFKYESPVERKLARTKAKTRNSAAAKARRGD